MKKHITNIHGQSQSSTAMIGQHMVADIAMKNNYAEIAIPAFAVASISEEELNDKIEKMIADVNSDDLVVAQLPTWNGIAFDKVFIRLVRERCKKLAVFVHDFVPLMFENNRYLMNAYLDAYNQADVVVLPSTKMGNILIEEGLRVPYLIQDVWDHVTELTTLGTPMLERNIKFAGNMTRFPFVKNWQQDIPLDVYSDSQSMEQPNPHINIKGWKNDNELLQELNQGGFGLVWSENIENQAEREYSTMNASFKFSTYLAAGIPIIVNQNLAKQKFVEKYGLGYVASSLDEVADYVKNISESDYDVLRQNVNNVSGLIRDGFFTRKVLNKIEEQTFLGH